MIRHVIIVNFLKALLAVLMLMPGFALADKIKVVTTFSILEDMTRQVAGDRAIVYVLVDANSDTHSFTPTPKDARLVADADVIVMNGLGFDRWLNRLISASGFDGELIVAGKNMPVQLKGRADDHHDDHAGHDDYDDHAGHDKHDAHHDGHAGHDDHDDHAGHDKHDAHHDGHASHDNHDDHAGHDKHDAHHDGHASHYDHDDHAGHDKHDAHHDGHASHDNHDEHHSDHASHDDDKQIDPHVWHSTKNARAYVAGIAAGLGRADPKNAAYYNQRMRRYQNTLSRLERNLRRKVRTIPKENRHFLLPHNSLSYLGNEFGFDVVSISDFNTSADQSAGRLGKIIKEIRRDKVRVAFFESFMEDRLMKRLIKEADLREGGYLYTDSLSDKDGPAANYLKLMQHNVTTLVEALKP